MQHPWSSREFLIRSVVASTIWFWSWHVAVWNTKCDRWQRKCQQSSKEGYFSSQRRWCTCQLRGLQGFHPSSTSTRHTLTFPGYQLHIPASTSWFCRPTLLTRSCMQGCMQSLNATLLKVLASLSVATSCKTSLCKWADSVIRCFRHLYTNINHVNTSMLLKAV